MRRRLKLIKIVLSVEDYNVTFDREIMEHVSLSSSHAGIRLQLWDQTVLERRPFFVMLSKESPAIRLGENVKMGISFRCMGSD